MEMNSEIVVQQETDLAIVPQFHAVAVNATEMANAKTGIKKWLEAKVLSIDAEIAQLQETLDAAIRHKWKSSGFKSQLQREKQKHLYYQKLLAAVHAGYTIIPNLDCDVFAIRVNRSSPSAKSAINKATGYEPCAPRIDDETEQRLPVGDGRYESPFQTTDTLRWDEKNEKNEIVHKVKSYAIDFAEIEFPLAIANPLVMDATANAMAMKIFDRIGIARDRTQVSGDPIVLGQITRKVGYQLKTASFLIAWYLDFRTL
jgi:hypothetical protein